MDVEDRPGFSLRTSQIIPASKHCVFSIIGCDFIGHYRFKESVYGLSDFPTVFQEHIDIILEFKTQVWLDDIICVTNGSADDPERDLREVLSKLEKTGYRASEKKDRNVQKRTDMAPTT